MRLHKGKCYLAASFLALSVVATGWAAGAAEGAGPERPAFRSDTTLVLVPVTVVDHRGAMVNGLAVAHSR